MIIDLQCSEKVCKKYALSYLAMGWLESRERREGGRKWILNERKEQGQGGLKQLLDNFMQDS